MRHSGMLELTLALVRSGGIVLILAGSSVKSIAPFGIRIALYSSV